MSKRKIEEHFCFLELIRYKEDGTPKLPPLLIALWVKKRRKREEANRVFALPAVTGEWCLQLLVG